MNEKGIEPPKNVELPTDSILYKWLLNLYGVFPKTQTYTATLDPTSVSANTTSEQTFTVTGLTTMDIVYVNKPSHQAGLGIVNCRVSAANTLAITFMNATGSPIDPSSEDYFIVSVRR